MTSQQIEEAIHGERVKADARYGSFKSSHEGLGVLLEEFDELKRAIHSNDLDAVRREAIQVSAVAWRLALSLSDCACCERSQP